jgi:vacuolar-type H+-ATPase subunit I/STV1
MTTENSKYEKMVEILRKSKPDMFQPEELEKEVIKRIQLEDQNNFRLSDFIESLFGWVYIGWVRRSLMGAAVILVALFVYQQAFIFRQVKNISKLIVITGNETAKISSSDLEKRLTLYQMSTRFNPEEDIKISGRQIEKLLDSYKDLQVKYKDLLRIIEEDPELKNYIEKKLEQGKKYKPDI